MRHRMLQFAWRRHRFVLHIGLSPLVRSPVLCWGRFLSLYGFTLLPSKASKASPFPTRGSPPSKVIRLLASIARSVLGRSSTAPRATGTAFATPSFDSVDATMHVDPLEPEQWVRDDPPDGWVSGRGPDVRDGRSALPHHPLRDGPRPTPLTCPR